MAQATNPSIASGQTGTQYRTQDNDRYAAALTSHSGSSRPSYAVAGTLWLDTTSTPWIVKMYDGADDISIGTVNATTNQFNASNAASTGSTIAMTAAINEASGTIASASTTNIGAASANYLSVTGTTTITAFDTVQAGTERTLVFAGVLTLTHNATSLIIPGGANITTAAGDRCIVRSEGSGNWRVVVYVPAAGLQTYDAATAKTNVAQSFSKTQTATSAALTSGNAADFSTYQVWTAAPNGGTFTITNPTNPVTGALYLIVVSYTTSNTLAWGTYFKGVSAITPTATAGAVDTFLFRYQGSNVYALVGYNLNGAA